MTGLEAADLYRVALKAYETIATTLRGNERYLAMLEAGKLPVYEQGQLRTARTAVKRNRRRLRQAGKLKAALEAALRPLRAKISAGDVDALWPTFMTREGKLIPPWRVPEELAGKP